MRQLFLWLSLLVCVLEGKATKCAKKGKKSKKCKKLDGCEWNDTTGMCDTITRDGLLGEFDAVKDNSKKLAAWVEKELIPRFEQGIDMTGNPGFDPCEQENAELKILRGAIENANEKVGECEIKLQDTEAALMQASKLNNEMCPCSDAVQSCPHGCQQCRSCPDGQIKEDRHTVWEPDGFVCVDDVPITAKPTRDPVTSPTLKPTVTSPTLKPTPFVPEDPPVTVECGDKVHQCHSQTILMPCKVGRKCVLDCTHTQTCHSGDFVCPPGFVCEGQCSMPDDDDNHAQSCHSAKFTGEWQLKCGEPYTKQVCHSVEVNNMKWQDWNLKTMGKDWNEADNGNLVPSPTKPPTDFPTEKPTSINQKDCAKFHGCKSEDHIINNSHLDCGEAHACKNSKFTCASGTCTANCVDHHPCQNSEFHGSWSIDCGSDHACMGSCGYGGAQFVGPGAGKANCKFDSPYGR